MGSKRSRPERDVRSAERERFRVRDQFGVVLMLLMVTVFSFISAPNELWDWLATTVALVGNLGRTRTPLVEIDERAPQRNKEEPG